METIQCSNCGIEMRDTEQTREEMELHESECFGTTDPRERFEVGEKVKYSKFGMERLNKEQRYGEIAGFSHDDHCVRVLWDGRKTPAKYAHTFIKHQELKERVEREMVVDEP